MRRKLAQATDARLESTKIEPAIAGESLMFNISITNEIRISRVRREIERTLADTSARDIIMSVVLAVDEATQNIIRHAFPDNMSGTIKVSGYLADGLLHISLVDDAPLIDLDKVNRAISMICAKAVLAHISLWKSPKHAEWLHR